MNDYDLIDNSLRNVGSLNFEQLIAVCKKWEKLHPRLQKQIETNFENKKIMKKFLEVTYPKWLEQRKDIDITF